jgi:hypothetical protein
MMVEAEKEMRSRSMMMKGERRSGKEKTSASNAYKYSAAGKSGRGIG